MGSRKIQLITFVLSAVAFALGFMLAAPEQYGICPPEAIFSCIEPLGNQIGQPLMMGGAAVTLVLLILLFLPERFFRAWLKFAAWTIPLGALWIATTPDSCGGGLGFALCLDREIVTWYVCGTVLVISLLVIIWHAWRGRKV